MKANHLVYRELNNEEIKPRVGPICENVLSDNFYLKILKVSVNLSGCFRALKKKNMGETNSEFKSE